MAMGSRCQYVDPETSEQCTVTDPDKLDLHHITDVPLGDDYNRFQEMTHWLRTGELPKDEELRCELHHNLETAIQIGDEIAVAKWRVKLRQQRQTEEGS